MAILDIVFWVSFILLVYTYIGYPILLMCINIFKSFFKKSKNNLPIPTNISIVIAAFNECDFIVQKIQNLYQLQLPFNTTQIICITDGSTDGTEKLVQQNFPNVLVLHQNQRNGKAAAINRTIPFCTGDIIIFSDANTWINPFGVSKMLRHFANANVGAVAGEKRIVMGKLTDTALHGESLYWRYEAWVKKSESNANVVIGAVGELFALRKNLYEPVPENFINEDFVLSVGIAKAGYKVVYEPDAYAMEYPSATLNDEMKRKVRIAMGSFQLINKFKSLFNVFKYKQLSWQFVSRKIFRWALCPVLLIVVFFVNMLIFKKHNFYAFVFLMQTLFYFFASIGYFIAQKGKNVSLFISPFYFVFMHLCQLIGFVKFINGIPNTNWEKVKRVSLD